MAKTIDLHDVLELVHVVERKGQGRWRGFSEREVTKDFVVRSFGGEEGIKMEPL